MSSVVRIGPPATLEVGARGDYDPEVTSPLVSVSVDLDAVECYHRIHALGEAPTGEARFAILRRALPRLGELFAKHGITATLFVVGRDLEDDDAGRRIVAELARAGHEIASHSYSHPYDLARLPREEMAAELDRAHAPPPVAHPSDFGRPATRSRPSSSSCSASAGTATTRRPSRRFPIISPRRR